MSMQARQFWPPIKHKLLYTNLIVYGATLVLLVVFGHELMWAQKTLRGYVFSGNIPPSADRLLVSEAIRGAKRGEALEHTRRLLERAVQIEPYSNARLLLGYCYLRQAEYDKMLACYEQYRSIDPSHIDVYRDMIEVLERKQDRKAIARLLTEGSEHFRRRIELYQPHLDPDVQGEFNLKALRIYKKAQEGLKLLEKIEKRLNNSK